MFYAVIIISNMVYEIHVYIAILMEKTRTFLNTRNLA